MRNKGLIIGFAIILGILSVYNLSYTWYANKIESKAKSIGGSDERLKKRALDSLAKDTTNLIIAQYNYVDAKKKEVNLGLDLKGGINVILQVSVKELLADMADKSQNPFFVDLLKKTDEVQKSSSASYIDDFFSQFNDSEKTVKLASPAIFGNKNNSESIKYNSTDEEVEQFVRTSIEAKVATAYKVIRQRIDRFGVSQPNVQRIKGSSRILVELPGVKDTERVKKLLQSTAKLEFWEVVRLNDDVDRYIGSLPLTYDASDSIASKKKLSNLLNPFYAGYTVKLSDTAQVNSILNNKISKKRLPSHMKYYKFLSIVGHFCCFAV